MNNIIYFKIGGCTLYTTDEYYYWPSLNIWNFQGNEDSSYFLKTEQLKLNNWKQPEIQQLNDFGWFEIGKVILHGHSWGLQLNTGVLLNEYNGKNTENVNWVKILQHPLISAVFRRYNEHIEWEKKTTKKYVYNKTIKTTEDDPEIDFNLIPPVLYSVLQDHQKHEIGWMLNLETNHTMELSGDVTYTPLLDTGLYLNHNDTSRLYKKHEIKGGEKINIPGGILASRTGIGKTISTIGLLSTDLKKQILPNLVIVTKNILWQWYEEFNKFCPQLDVYVVETLAQATLDNLTTHHIVLTYRDLFSDTSKINLKNFYKIIWNRIIFDEFHEIVKTPYEKNLTKLMACFKWGLTGTLNDVDLVTFNSVFELLDIKHKSFGINKTIQITSNTTSNSWSECLDFLFEHSMRRNTTIKLTKLTVKKKPVSFCHLLRLIYKSESMINLSNSYELCSHYTDIWKPPNQLLAYTDKLAIDYITLKRKNEIKALEKVLVSNTDPSEYKRITDRINTYKNSNDYFQTIIDIINDEVFECLICFEEKNTSDIVILDCMHIFCHECFSVISEKGFTMCMACKTPLAVDSIIVHPKFKIDNGENKVSVIISEILKVPDGEKIILFTQFDSLVAHLSEIFMENNINHILLKGSLCSPNEINISLTKFKTNLNIKVLLMSIEQSASGINVIEANHVFFAHPLFNYDVASANKQYKQCIGRCHRYGQTKPVTVTFFITKDSIEENKLLHITL